MEINGNSGMEEKEFSQNTSLSQGKHDSRQHFMLIFPLASKSKMWV